MIVHNLTLTGKGHAFVVMHPEDFDTGDNLFEELLGSGNQDAIDISTGPWLYYQEEGTEDDDNSISAWPMPGIKMRFKDEIGFDKAKSMADEFVAKIKNDTGVDMQLVWIDQERLSKL